MAFVFASLVSSASVAQAQAPASADRIGRQEQRMKLKGERGGRGARGARSERGRAGLMKGIKLGDAERTQLVAIRARYRAEGQSLRASLRPAMLDVRAARVKGDTAAIKALRGRHAGARAQLKALHDRQVTEVRGALSAENQRVFDANRAERATRRAEWAKGGKAGRMEGRRGAPGRHRGHQRARRAGANG